MTNDELKELILTFNKGEFPSFFSLRHLSDTVVLGYIWPERPTGQPRESSKKVYFICSASSCVGIILEMGFHHSGNPFQEESLHWHVLEEHRGHGHLYAALRDCVLPHIFSDGRESQRATADSQYNANYVLRQGFVPTDNGAFIMQKDKVDLSRVSTGRNLQLTRKQVDEMATRLREAKSLVNSVHEMLKCRYGHDALDLKELAESIENNDANSLGDLDDDGNLRSLN